MQKKIEAINLKCLDSGEYDKYITFLTLSGKYSATLKGVKKSNSKQKFAGELFSCNEFVLNEKNMRYTITSASSIDLFYEIRNDYEKVFVASIMVKFCDKFVQASDDASEIYQVLKESLNLLKTKNANAVLTYFLVKSLEIEGYALELNVCSACGDEIEKSSNYSVEKTSIVCANCEGLGISSQVLDNLRECSIKNFDRFEQDYWLKTCKLLAFHIENCVEKFDILENYIKQ